MSILSGIISTVLSLITGAILGFFLLITLNGFSGKAGDYAVYTYIGWAIIVALMVGAISFFASNFLIKGAWNKALAVILPILASLILSGIGDFIGMIVAGIVANTMWKK